VTWGSERRRWCEAVACLLCLPCLEPSVAFWYDTRHGRCPV